MKRLITAMLALAALLPLQSAIAGNSSTSGADLAFYDPATSRWDFTGGPDVSYGAPGDLPIMCDWDGDGVATVGVYRDRTGYLLLQNHNGSGPAEHEFYYGMKGDRPVCGDWDGDGIDTIGIFRPSEARFYLRNSNDQGFGQVDFAFGFSDGQPFAGDWDGDGIDTVGLRDPKNGFLTVAAANASGPPALETYYGLASDALLVGDWDGNGTDRFAVYRQETQMLAVSEDFSNPVATGHFSIDAAGIPLASEWKNDGGITREAPEWIPPPEPAPAPEAVPAPAEPPAPAPQPAPAPEPAPAPATDGALNLWDTVWQIAAKADRGSMEQYVDRLAAARGSAGQNITGFWFSVPNINQDINTPNGFGHTFGSFDNPNADYLADIDTLLTLANERGLRAGIVVAWDGPNQWSVESGKLNSGNAYNYGRTIAERWTRPDFPARSSVAAWVMGGDTTNDGNGGEHGAVWSEVVRGIRDGEAANGFTPAPVLFHTAPGHHLDYLGADWLDGHSPQTGHCYSRDQAADWLRELQNHPNRTASVWGNGEMRYETIDWDCNGGPISASDVLGDAQLMAELGFMDNFVYGFDPRWNASNPGEVGMSADGVSEGLQRILDEPGLIRSRTPLR